MANKIGLNYPTKDELGYFTTEQDTGSTWIDGSTLYKKTIELGALPNATTKAVSHGISNLNIVVKIEGFAVINGRTLPLPHVSTGQDSHIGIEADRSYVVVKTFNYDRSGYTGYITLYYTKVENND